MIKGNDKKCGSKNMERGDLLLRTNKIFSIRRILNKKRIEKQILAKMARSLPSCKNYRQGGDLLPLSSSLVGCSWVQVPGSRAIGGLACSIPKDWKLLCTQWTSWFIQKNHKLQQILLICLEMYLIKVST